MILRKVAALAEKIASARTPIEVSPEIQAIVRKIIGVADPFSEVKHQANREALALLPRLRDEVSRASDPLELALALAAGGNIADLGASATFDLAQVESALNEQWGRFDYDLFQARLAKAKSVLILADNAGEIAFDRILVQELLRLGKRVTVAVRGEPTLNDATLADAREVGLTDLVPVITTGSNLPGVLLARSSPEFQEHFRRADLVIAKGMGNFEGLSEEAGVIAFLLVAKCDPVARELGVEVGKLVLKIGNSLGE